MSCFTTFHAGSIEFDLLSSWHGKLKISFAGSLIKHVEVTSRDYLGNVQSTTYFSCESLTPILHPVSMNQSHAPVKYSITPMFSHQPCTGPAKSPGDTQVGNYQIYYCSETGQSSKAHWLFPLGGNDTINIIIDIVNQSGGGDGLLFTIKEEVLRLSAALRKLIRYRKS